MAPPHAEEALIPDHDPDGRSLNFADGTDEHGQLLPMAAEILRAWTEKWLRSSRTTDG